MKIIAMMLVLVMVSACSSKPVKRKHPNNPKVTDRKAP